MYECYVCMCVCMLIHVVCVWLSEVSLCCDAYISYDMPVCYVWLFCMCILYAC